MTFETMSYLVVVLGHRARIRRDGARWVLVFADPKYGTCWSSAMTASGALVDAKEHVLQIDWLRV